jgi:hypothetical protein
MTMPPAAAIVLDPAGRDLAGGTVFSGEQLSRNIQQPIALIAVAIPAAMLLMERAHKQHVKCLN